MAKHPKARTYLTTIQDSGNPNYVNRLLIGTASTGLVRIEWFMARNGQVIPTNWSKVEMLQFMNSYIPLRYQVADAQNLIVKAAVEGNYEWCFRGDTVVETIGGGKKIKDVEVGNLVKTHTGAFRAVTKVMKREVKQRHPMLWIHGPSSTIKCTEGHPFFAIQEGKDEPEWVEAINLHRGDFMLYPYNEQEDILKFDVRFNKSVNDFNGRLGSIRNGSYLGDVVVTRSLARFMGLYLAEGHREQDCIAFTFNNDESDMIELVTGVCKDVFGRKPTIRQTWATQVKLNIRCLSALFCDWFGENAREKKVPEFVYGWNVLNQLEFLKGYLDGDGSYKNDGCAFSTTSERLMAGICRLIALLGLESAPVYWIEPKVSATLTRQDGRDVISNGLHISRIPNKSLEKMHDLLSAEYENSYLRIPIQAVEMHPLAANLVDSAVYNLEVEVDNSYIADCAAVHNCLFWEHDSVFPPDALLRFNQYMRDYKVPVVSGLYFTRSYPSEPIIYRGRGNSFYTNWKKGDKVWCDGVPTGALLVHMSVIRAMWDDLADQEYTLNGIRTRPVFQTPNKVWEDPETGMFNTTGGTSDLEWCTTVIQKNYLAKAGWKEYQDNPYPFLVDTNIWVGHINPDGQLFGGTAVQDFDGRAKRTNHLASLKG